MLHVSDLLLLDEAWILIQAQGVHRQWCGVSEDTDYPVLNLHPSLDYARV